MVELEQAAIWRFLWWSGTISVHVLVDQNREDHSVRTHCCFRWCVCLRNVLQFTDMGGLRNVLLWLHLVGRKHMFTTQTNGYFVENEFSNVQYKENILYLDFLLIKHRTPLPKGIGGKLTEFICILFSCSCFQITSIRGRFIFSNLLVPNFKENLFQMFLRISPDIGQTSRSDSHSNWTRFYLFLQMTRSK